MYIHVHVHVNSPITIIHVHVAFNNRPLHSLLFITTSVLFTIGWPVPGASFHGANEFLPVHNRMAGTDHHIAKRSY